MAEKVDTGMNLSEAPITEEKAVLGILEGPCADFVDGTRNGRKYTEELWDKVFKDPIVLEQIHNGGLPGELDHPTDRSETDSTKIAVLLSDVPQKKNGKLWAKFKILNTPCGRIAFTLAKAGFHLGISSRGEGDVHTDYTGEEIVDPDSYTLNAFDVVLLPSVKDARMNLITESYDRKKFDYKKELRESLKSAPVSERKVMRETLKDLNIDIADHRTTVDNVKVDEDTLSSLKESLKQNSDLRNQVKALQEKLSVCNTKEAKLTESFEKLKSQNKSLREDLDERNAEVDTLNEQLEHAKESMRSSKARLRRLSEELESQKSLNETLGQSEEVVERLNEQLDREREESKAKLNRLNEKLEDVKQNSVIKTREYNKKLKETLDRSNHYKDVAKAAVDKYINFRANMIGVPSTDITKRLGENYSFRDIDRICESLSGEYLSMNTLPFNNKKVTGVKLTESSDSSTRAFGDDDDDINDDALMDIVRRRLE